MKHISVMIVALVAAMSLHAVPRIDRAEPLSWWTDMQCPLTLMLQGEDLQDAVVFIEPAKGQKGIEDGLVVRSMHNAESPNYLFIDLDVVKAGKYKITLQKGKKKASVEYEINTRRPLSRDRKSFDASDVVYLIMSDRFVDGDEQNNSVPSMREKADKSNVNGRWGGDIAGIIQSMDHIVKLGATAIWPTPLLEDNEAAWSYHGYACSDYYHIDPRFGSNEQYKEMVQIAHEKGLKILMDMVPNHCGAAHWWMKDLPYHNWINQFDTFTNTNNVFSANYDPNAAKFDAELSNRGWFDHPMPDMNLDNSDLLKYMTQMAIWWIEYANLDGLRVDTYPYIGKYASSKWCNGILKEYPNLNIVGECWTRPAPHVAYWQRGAKNFDGYNSYLPSVMDFPTEEAIRQALENDGDYWGGGLTRVYDALTLDYLYSDVNNLLMFVGNHDMSRITNVVKDENLDRVKLSIGLIATMRGIPQLFYGDEYAMKVKDRNEAGNHSLLRMPLPKEEEVDAKQMDMFKWQSQLFQYRKHEPILHYGRTMHFLDRNNTYAFFRYTDKGAVFVFANASEDKRTIPTSHYAEILDRYQPVGKEVMTGEKIDLSRKDLVVGPLSIMIVRLEAKGDSKKAAPLKAESQKIKD